MNIKKMLESENGFVSKKQEMDVLRKIFAEIQGHPSDLYLKSLFSTQMVEYIENQIKDDCSCNIAEDLSFVETQRHQLVDEHNQYVGKLKREYERETDQLKSDVNKMKVEIEQLNRDKQNLKNAYNEYHDKYFAIADKANSHDMIKEAYSKLAKKFETMKNIFEM